MPHKVVKKRRPKRQPKKAIKGKGVVSQAKKVYKRHRKKINAGLIGIGGLALGTAALVNHHRLFPPIDANGRYTGRRPGLGLTHPMYSGI